MNLFKKIQYRLNPSSFNREQQHRGGIEYFMLLLFSQWDVLFEQLSLFYPYIIFSHETRRGQTVFIRNPVCFEIHSYGSNNPNAENNCPRISPQFKRRVYNVSKSITRLRPPVQYLSHENYNLPSAMWTDIGGKISQRLGRSGSKIRVTNHWRAHSAAFAHLAKDQNRS